MSQRFFFLALCCGVLFSGAAQADPCPPSEGRVIADGCEITFAGGAIETGGSNFNAAVVAQNAGSVLVQGPIQITTAGDDASGVYVQSNGSVVFAATGNTITTSGEGAYGVHSFHASSFSGQASITTSGTQAHAAFEDFGGTVTMSSSSFVTHGERSAGVATQGSGGIRLTGSNSIVTTGDSAPGMYAINNGSHVDVDATGGTLSIQTGGVNSSGVMVDNGGDISVVGPVTIRTAGDTSHGLSAVDGGSAIDARGLAARTEGNMAFGATASGGATLTLGSATLETLGASSHGLAVAGAGSSLTASQVDVVTQRQAYGAWAGDGGQLTWNGGSVRTFGDGAAGLVVEQASRITASDVRVATTGPFAHGAVVRDGATLELHRANIHVAGASSHLLYSDASGNNAPTTILVDGGMLRADQSTAIRVAGATTAIAVRNGAAVVSDMGRLMEVGAQGGVPGAALLTADQATLRGDILVDASGGSVADVVLAQGSALAGAASGVRNMTIGASRWTISGDSSIADTLLNAGVIDFSPQFTPVMGASKAQAVGDAGLAGMGFKTLTTNHYVSQGGALVFNTYLDGDSSPTDRLVVSGSATGATLVQVRNAQGPGEITRQGILIIERQGSLGQGTFSLAAPVVAGPYEYTLQHGSLASGTAQNLYLRSTIDCSVPSAASPPCPAPAPPGPPGPGPAPAPEPAPEPAPIPNYRPETSLYTAIAPLALQYGRSLLDTLHERVGGTQRSADGASRLAWGRAIGLHGSRDGDRAGIYGRGPSYDYQFAGAQLGTDLLRRESAGGGRDHAGVYAAIGHASVDVTHFTGRSAGTDRFDGYTAGGYWTHYGRGDGYVDALVQATWYDAKANSSRGLSELSTKGFGIGGSLEGGYPLLRSGPWKVEPQAQIVYQRVELDDASDAGATIRFSDIESLAGRIGVRVARAWPQDASGGPGILDAWVRLSAWREFLGNPKTQFSSVRGFIPFQADLGGTWGELKAGVTAQLRRDLSLHGSVGYEKGLDGKRQSWDGKLGLRLVW